MLSANYLWEDPALPFSSQLGSVSVPYVIRNVQGLRVAIIGIANLSTMNSAFDTGNRLGITPLDPVQTAQFYIEFLSPQVDVVVLLTHLGLQDDERLLEQIAGVDVMLGGHHHVVLNPPKMVEDPSGRSVIMAHSGAFAKYVGRLDVVVRQCRRIPECVARYAALGRDPPDNDWEVVSHQYRVIPVDSTAPEDPEVSDIIERYVDDMSEQIDLTQLVGYAPALVRRFSPVGGDSELGNLVATSILVRQGVQTDFAMTNSLGIRTDFDSGPATVEEMYNVFPFENTITTFYLLGAEVRELFDFVTRRSTGRGCNTQVQIAGAAAVLDCGDSCPSGQESEGGGCAVELQPRVRRVLVGDASPEPNAACQEVAVRFRACCDETALCGCDDEICLASDCERAAREQAPGCDESFEPFYSTFPCRGDDDCLARASSQRCFVPSGQRRRAAPACTPWSTSTRSLDPLRRL